MPVGQMSSSIRKDHGKCIVAHGIEVEHLKCPMVHSHMPMGKMSCRTRKAHGAGVEHLECGMVHSNMPMGEMWHSNRQPMGVP